MTGWQPIETAPRNVGFVLHDKKVSIAWPCQDGAWTSTPAFMDAEPNIIQSPECWMELTAILEPNNAR